MLSSRVEQSRECARAALWLTLICGSEGPRGLPGMSCGCPGSHCSTLFLFPLQHGGRRSVTIFRPRGLSKLNNKFLQLTLTVAIEVTTLFSFFSLARHNPLMVHSTRTS